jgi:hypothetical protein
MAWQAHSVSISLQVEQQAKKKLQKSVKKKSMNK